MKKLLNLIMIIALVCFCYSAYRLGSYAWHTHLTKQMSSELAGLVGNDAALPEIPSGGDTADGSTSGAAAADPQTGYAGADSEALRKAMQKKYAALIQRNSDFVGWLSIEGTDISYPVMQTPAEPEKYLEMNFDGAFDYHGTLFVDARCRLDPEAAGTKNADSESVTTDTIIYGHHMKDGTMFGSLPSFEDADYCRDHSLITFDTLYRPGSYRIFAVILDQAAEIGSDHEEDIYYNFLEAADEASLQTYLENMHQAAVYYDPDNEPKLGDEILTLSTCNYHVTDGRLAVLAVRAE